jgi:hypothetical protein
VPARRAAARRVAVAERGSLWIENQAPDSRKGAAIGWATRPSTASRTVAGTSPVPSRAARRRRTGCRLSPRTRTRRRARTPRLASAPPRGRAEATPEGDHVGRAGLPRAHRARSQVEDGSPPDFTYHVGEAPSSPWSLPASREARRKDRGESGTPCGSGRTAEAPEEAAELLHERRACNEARRSDRRDDLTSQGQTAFAQAVCGNALRSGTPGLKLYRN